MNERRFISNMRIDPDVITSVFRCHSKKFSCLICDTVWSSYEKRLAIANYDCGCEEVMLSKGSPCMLQIKVEEQHSRADDL